MNLGVRGVRVWAFRRAEFSVYKLQDGLRGCWQRWLVGERTVSSDFVAYVLSMRNFQKLIRNGGPREFVDAN